jgi:hypothetical protein
MPLLQPNQGGSVPLASTSSAREDLADYIAIVDAKSTPFVSMAPKGKDIGNMQFSWQVDNYGAPVLGGVPDGTDVTVSSASNPVVNRTRLNNYAQAFRRDLRIGFIAETQDVAGVTDEVANGIAKKLVEIKRDMESTFMCTNQAAQMDTGPGGNAYRTGSMGNWLNADNSANIGAVASGSPFKPASGAVDGTAAASFTEATAQNVLTAIYSATGTFPTTIVSWAPRSSVRSQTSRPLASLRSPTPTASLPPASAPSTRTCPTTPSSPPSIFSRETLAG